MIKDAKIGSIKGKMDEDVNAMKHGITRMTKRLEDIDEIAGKLKETRPRSKEYNTLVSQLDLAKAEIVTYNNKQKEALTGITEKGAELDKILVSSDEIGYARSATKSGFFEDSDIISKIITKYENLSALGQLALSILIFKYLILSSLVTIIYIFYGNYLLTKFNIEVKYPKLAIAIKLAKKFRTYNL
jgi:hypothetical protein